MSETHAYVLRPSPEDPPALVAARTFDKSGYSVPVPIADLARLHAAVDDSADWEEAGCDGIVVGLNSNSGPKIFVRSSQSYYRGRFTLAHELGHVRLIWHDGVKSCAPTPRETASEDSPSPHGAIQVARARHEYEATRFASFTLMPEAWLRERITRDGVEGALAAIDDAQVSALAGIIRVKEALRPGHAFCFEDSTRRRVNVSPGTLITSSVWNDREAESNLRESAARHGELMVSGWPVRWYHLLEHRTYSPESDERTTREILRAAMSKSGCKGDAALTLERQINGVVGSALSMHAHPTDTDEQVYSILRHRTDDLVRFDWAAGNTDFDLFLRRKTAEWKSRQK